MPVMQIGIVRVRMDQRGVNVGVGVRLASIPIVVRVLMVLIVCMGVAVRLLLVRMPMGVAFGEVQPNARCHQSAGDDEPPG